jgi:SAM-dependent methyltransferase
MTTSVPKLILYGLYSWLVTPPVGTGGTVSARYCYSVFLRHRLLAARCGLAKSPSCVVELGPGDSLGVGLMALLTGAQRCYAADAVRHASAATNLAVFEGLVALLKKRAPIPTDGDCAEIRPVVDEHGFPSHLFDRATLDAALAPQRLDGIRRELGGDLSGEMIRYLAPWGELRSVPDNSVDWVFSQAVMEHVDRPAETYREALRCLRPDGFMSHQIDFRSHETAAEWNGHLKYPGWLWRLMRGNRPWFINRLPCSAHLRMQRDAGFTIINEMPQLQSNPLSRSQLATEFKAMTAQDLQVAGAMIVSRPGAPG